MVGNDVVHHAEPIDRQCRKNLSFVRNQGGQDPVEGGDAVARDQQNFAPKTKNVASFALIKWGQTRQCVIAHRLEFSYWRWIRSLQFAVAHLPLRQESSSH